jgi:hypothetical protein
MTKKEILKQLHNLNQDIKPDAEWKASNREILLSQIKAQTLTSQTEHKILWHVFWAKKFMLAAYKPLGAMILIFGVILGGYTMTVGAAKNSLPGDFLYPIKLTTERMQVNLAGNDEKKTNLEIVFAERRLEEMQKVADKSGNDSTKKENLQVSLQKYQESINNVKSGLSKLEKTDSKTALKVAKLIDEKTKGYVDILKQQNDTNSDLSQTTGTADAITASKSMGEKALDVIITEFQAGNSQISIDEVYQKLDDMTKGLADNIEKAKIEVDKILANKKIAEAKASTTVKNEVLPDTTVKTPEAQTQQNTNVNTAPEAPVQEDKNSEEILPTLDELKLKLVEAGSILSQARGDLVARKIISAYEKAKQTADIMTTVEKVIAANKEYLEEPKTEAADPAKEEPAPAINDVQANTNVNQAK